MYDKIEQPEKTTKDATQKFYESIVTKERDISEELVERHFKSRTLSEMFYSLYYTGKEKNIILVNDIKSGLRDLKKEIKEMSEEEIRIEKPHKLVYFVEEILKFSEKHQNQQ